MASPFLAILFAAHLFTNHYPRDLTCTPITYPVSGSVLKCTFREKDTTYTFFVEPSVKPKSCPTQKKQSKQLLRTTWPLLP
jgi:hypothetical protein